MKSFLKNKKFLLIAGVLFLLCIIIINALYSIKQPENQSPLTITPYPTYPQSLPLSDSVLPTPPNNWVTGDNPSYSIKFPPTWKPIITSVEGGGTNVVLQPSPAPNQYFPRFDIEAAPTDPNNPIQKRVEQLKGLAPVNYSEIRTTFRSAPAIQISEILPIADMQGNPVHKTYIFFTKQSTTYVVTFAYFQDSASEANKQILLQILNSVALK